MQDRDFENTKNQLVAKNYYYSRVMVTEILKNPKIVVILFLDICRL